MDELKLATSLDIVLQNLGPCDVHRHQVGRELDAAELERERFGQLAYQQRLRQAWYPHQQGVPAGKKASRQPLDHVVLTDDHPPQLGPQLTIDLAKMIDRTDVVVAWQG